MKNLKLVFIGLFLILTFNGFANESRMKFHWGFGTAGIVYGDDTTKELTKTLTNDEFSRMILSGDLGLSIKLDKSIRFVTGGNISYDLFMKNSQNASFLTSKREILREFKRLKEILRCFFDFIQSLKG